MNPATTQLPHWDMSTVYPGLDSAEFQAGLEDGIQALDKLVAQFDKHGIMLRELPLEANTETSVIFEEILAKFNALGAQLHTLEAYVYSFISTNSRNETAQACLSHLQQELIRFSQLSTRFTAWIGSLADVEGLIDNSKLAAEHAFALRKAAIQAQHLMSPAEEALTSDLRLTGGSAWVKLYSNVTSQINVSLELEGEEQTLPLTAVRNLAYDPDRDVRRRAYNAELAAWEANALPIAAALNSIKGEMLALSKRRGWETPLDVALFNNNIDRQTLDAMLTASREFFPELRRYLKIKARGLGVSKLAWYDLFAPLGKSEEQWEFAEAQQFILTHFASYSEPLAALAHRAFTAGWIDAEPRAGKEGGAFCMWLRQGESRILANYQPAYSGMGTLAHELGHAYHNLRRAECSYTQRSTPMTLAETASTFCETIVREAALEKANRQEQLAIIEASLQDSLQVTMDITSRFIFEQEVFARRQERELSTAEFCQIMLEAQRATYGEGLDTEFLHPYMWAVKSHYYGSTFYNFPYMFGQLFSLGLYARYQADPDTFKASYDDLLASTGMAEAAELAARFDIDIRTPAFWVASLGIIKEDIDRLAALIP
ncbi:MAG TPA: M3 family oligoendopeptidase [Thermoflexia bacterium]|nr:M3 family oligoendopeptidase [Thermoflexia bacterium]